MKSNQTPFHHATTNAEATNVDREPTASTLPRVPPLTAPPPGTIPTYAAHYEELGREFALALARARWEPAETAELAELRSEFLSKQKARGLEAAKASAASRRLALLTRHAAVFRRRVTAAFVRLVHQGATGIEPRFLKVGGRNDTVARSIAWLTSAQGQVGRFRPQLQGVLGSDASARLTELLAALVDTVAVRGRARARVVAMTAAAHSVALEIAKRVASLRAVARVAFAEQPAVLRQFRLPKRRAGTPQAIAHASSPHVQAVQVTIAAVAARGAEAKPETRGAA
jgi:hypothetical protein